MVSSLLFTEKSFKLSDGLFCLFLRLCSPFCLSFFQRKFPMSSNFTKIRRKNDSFYAGDIFLDSFETIRIVGGEEGVRNGLEFMVFGRDVRITDHWRGDGEAQTDHFHMISL